MPSKMAQDLENNNMSDDSDLCSVLSMEDSEEAEEALSCEGIEAQIPKAVTCPCVIWTGVKKKTPVLIFKADAIVSKGPEQKTAGENYHLAFKMMKTECKLVRSILTAHGFHEAHQNSSDFNIMWTGSHLKPYVLRGLFEFQKVNHFPRSYEVTRKDRLYKNIQRMQQIKGYKHFDVVPQTFVIPSEYQDFCAAAYKEKSVWIVKPAASSRGRGIYLVTNPDQVSVDDSVVICRYINNPLLINGFKFDVRLYVAVTSFDPLLIYLYEEGLTRFATVKFDKSLKTIRNNCMHLTNYSVNKRSSDYVSNDDADVEDFGNKWSLGALLRYLRSQGIDATALMMSIEDVIIKTLISVELPIASACKMFQPYRGNCFELFGFDILIDENLRPWVLEVNLSPSLACDAPLDLKIKSNMISDLFSLVGLECHDPMTRKAQLDGYWNPRVRLPLRAQSAKLRPKTGLLTRKGVRHWPKVNVHFKSAKLRPKTGLVSTRRRPDSAYLTPANTKQSNANANSSNSNPNLTIEEQRILRRTKEEYTRRGGWVRMFPTPDTWDTYSSYLQYSTTYNSLLHQYLFSDGLHGTEYKSSASRQRMVNLHSIPNSQLANGLQLIRQKLCLEDKPSEEPPLKKIFLSFEDDEPMDTLEGDISNASSSQPNNLALVRAMQRSKQYERKLICLGQNSKHQSLNPKQKSKKSASSGKKATLVQGTPQEVFPPSSVPHKQEGVKTGSEGKQDAKQKNDSKEPNMDVVKMLENGLTISKCQARFAFSTYLTCIKERLLAETNGKAETNGDAANEQMDLVLRFLQRAANNLQQPFKLVIPSSKLPVNTRRQALAKQLHEFIGVYDKETEELKKRMEVENHSKLSCASGDHHHALDDAQFHKFVVNATENELEEVLTVFTKISKSASIFLRSCSKPEHPPNNNGTVTGRQVESCLPKRRDAAASSAAENTRNPSSPQKPSTQETVGHTGGSQASGGNGFSILPLPANLAARMMPNTMSSYASAVTVYSAKMGNHYPPLKHRPISAVNQNAQGGCTMQKTRPLSAANAVEGAAGSANHSNVSADGVLKQNLNSNDAVTSTLQKLAFKQKLRQYYSGTSPLVVGTEANSTGQSVVLKKHSGKNGLYHKVRSSNIENQQTFERGDEEMEVPDRSVKVRCMVSVNRPENDAGRETSGGLTGAGAQDALPHRNGVSALDGSSYFEVQQSMIEQSRALLEESKAKHHALVAQAHSIQKQLVHDQQCRAVRDSEGLAPSIMPKPPSKPLGNERKRSCSRSHRLVRTLSHDESRRLEDCGSDVDNLDHV